jgi:hypothetical protein
MWEQGAKGSLPKTDTWCEHTFTQHGLEISILVCSQLVPNCVTCYNQVTWRGRKRKKYIFNIIFLFVHERKTFLPLGRRGLSKTYTGTGTLIQWLRYFGLHFTQVPHTYSVEISLLLCCQLVPNCFDDWGILDSTLHRYPTHILSVNYCHCICICQADPNRVIKKENRKWK